MSDCATYETTGAFELVPEPPRGPTHTSKVLPPIVAVPLELPPMGTCPFAGLWNQTITKPEIPSV